MISAVGIKRILFADIDKVTADITLYLRFHCDSVAGYCGTVFPEIAT